MNTRKMKKILLLEYQESECPPRPEYARQLKQIKLIEERLTKTHQSRQQPILIKELVAYQVPGALYDNAGEYHPKNKQKQSSLLKKRKNEQEPTLINRITAYLMELVQFATKKHLENNGVNHSNAIRQDRKNHITRLLLNEDALYPDQQRGPLTEAGFRLLITNIHNIAWNAPENLHLAFSSVPVLTNGLIRDITILVQCGPNPVIYPYAKSSSVGPKQDANYYLKGDSKPTLYARLPIQVVGSRSEVAKTTLPAATLTWPAESRVKTDNMDPSDTAIFYQNVIKCKTAGGQEFLVGSDMCLDHFFEVAKRHLEDHFLQAASLLPEKVSHLILSNHISIFYQKLISLDVSQADPINSKHHKSRPFVDSIRNEIKLKINRKSKHSDNNTYELPTDSFTLKHPKFGPKTTIDVYPERELSTYPVDLKKKVLRHNTFMIGLDARHIYRAQHPDESAFIEKEIDQYIMEHFKDELKEINSFLEEKHKIIPAQNNSRKDLISCIHMALDRINDQIHFDAYDPDELTQYEDSDQQMSIETPETSLLKKQIHFLLMLLMNEERMTHLPEHNPQDNRFDDNKEEAKHETITGNNKTDEQIVLYRKQRNDTVDPRIERQINALLIQEACVALEADTRFYLYTLDLKSEEDACLENRQAIICFFNSLISEYKKNTDNTTATEDSLFESETFENRTLYDLLTKTVSLLEAEETLSPSPTKKYSR